MNYLFLFILDFYLKLFFLKNYNNKSKDLKLFNKKLIKLSLLKNRGLALSFLSGKKFFILFLNLIVLIFIYYESMDKPDKFNYYLILAGGLGNFIDRIVHGYVIDYFELFFIKNIYFNLSDLYIIVGMLLEIKDYLY